MLSQESLNRIYARLEKKEERRAVPYIDSLGNLTVGIGHRLDGGAIPFSNQVIDLILRDDVAAKVADCKRLLPFWDALDTVRSEAVLEMAFNGSLWHSPKMIAALAARNYELAAREVLDGPWKSQVGHRAVEIAEMIRTGTLA